MPRTTLTPYTVTQAGMEPTYVAVDSGNDMQVLAPPAGTRRILHIKTTGTTINLTTPVASGVNLDGLTVSSRTKACTGTADHFVGPFGGEHVNADGYIYFDFDVGTGGTIAALDVP